MSDPTGPRSPDEHEQTGTGTPRSADDWLPQPGSAGGAAQIDPAVSIGARASTDPAAADELRINRSGSGGSGGSATAEEQEGSTPASMSELLGGEDEEQAVDR